MTRPYELNTLFLGLIALVLTGAALHALGPVLIPVVLAFFTALIAAPVDAWVRARVPAALGFMGQVAALLVVLAVLGLFAFGLAVAAMQATTVFDALPLDVMDVMQEAAGGSDTDASLQAAGETLGAQVADGAAAGGDGREIFGMPLSQVADAIGGRAVGMMANIATLVATSTGTLITTLVLVVMLMALMLAERDRWSRMLANQLNARTEGEVEEALAQIAHKLRIFLVTRAVLGVVTAVFYGLWLWLFDVDLIIVWMLLAVLLNFIPTIGSIIAGSLPVLFTLVTRDPGTVAIIALGLFVLEQILGNVVDPYVQGRQISVSPVVVLIGLLVWGWVWGLTGTLLATPMIIVVLVICAHVPATRPFALMLSDKSDMDELLAHTGVRAG